MSYEIIERGGHVCVLPSVEQFGYGDVIACTDIVLRYGTEIECGRRWERHVTFWSGTPQWRPWQGGW